MLEKVNTLIGINKDLIAAKTEELADLAPPVAKVVMEVSFKYLAIFRILKI